MKKRKHDTTGSSWYHVDITKHYGIWASSAQQAHEQAAQLYQVPLADVVIAQQQSPKEASVESQH